MLDYEKLCQQWLVMKQTQVKSSSYHKYDRIMNMYVKDFYMKHDIEEIDVEMISCYLNELLNKGLSKSLVGTVKYVIKDVYCYVEEKYPLKHIDFGQIVIVHSQTKKELLDINEEKKLYDYCLQHINSSCLSILLALCQGLRISEICGLKYKDVNLEKGILNIHRVISRNYMNESEESKKVEELKKWPARREIVLADFLITYLNKYMSYHHEDDFLITNSDRVPTDRILQYHLGDINKELNIKCNFKMLRNTYKENCLNKGMNVWVLMENLGTSNLDLTLKSRQKSSIECMSKEIEKIYSMEY